MSAASESSLYEILILESNDQKRTVDIRLGAISIDYYEDVFSPSVTAKIKVVNTGDSISPPNSDGDPDGPRQSIYHGLPLRGGERLSIKVRDQGIDKDGETKKGLDFSQSSKRYLYVSSITDVISETQRESFTLNLVSREAITNETARVSKKYPTNLTIDQSVNLILKNVLKTDQIGKLDKSINKYGFIGNMKKPFNVLTWLASKAVPDIGKNSTAGFLFYQTQDGFQFRSIDSLISQESKASYKYIEKNESSITRNNDFNILNYSTDKNQNLIEKLRLGTYSTSRSYFDPLSFNFYGGKFSLPNYQDKIKNLGGKPIDLPRISSSSNQSLGEVPTRTLCSILDVGTMEKGVSKDVNADPINYQAQALMRYNVLFTQTLSMIVPCNTELRAGDIINCEFPKISSEDINEIDREQSGLYMIKELCHHFEPNRSYTSMKLVRDTFGKNKPSS